MLNVFHMLSSKYIVQILWSDMAPMWFVLTSGLLACVAGQPYGSQLSAESSHLLYGSAYGGTNVPTGHYGPLPAALPTSPDPLQIAVEQTKPSHPQDPDGDSIVGKAGLDYPIHYRIPETSFNCSERERVGYYVDAETDCQVFHICLESGGRVSFLCPNGTMFNQLYFVCDWWYNVDCSPLRTQANQAVSSSTPSADLAVTSDVPQQQEFADEDVTGSFGSRPFGSHRDSATPAKLPASAQWMPPYSQAHLKW